MPQEINGLPLHALIVHAAVVLVPLAAIAAGLFAVVPNWRFVLRWPVLVSAIVSFVTLYITKLSGQNLKNQRFASATGVLKERIAAHQQRANTLFLISIGFVVVVVGGVWLLGFARSKLPTAAQWAVSLVVVGFSVATLVWVVLTGEAGARTIWGQ
jgi:magnesium-transporting ATPase (P-type)